MDQKKEKVSFRFTETGDDKYLAQWLSEPGILRWFPCEDKAEVEDTVRMLVSFSKWRCSLTLLVDGVPSGIAILFLHAYRKIAHQCLFGIIIDEKQRNKGYGTQLIDQLVHLAQESFKLKVLYLEVFEGNPAISLYRRFGFNEVGFQKYWLKQNGKYQAKVTMEKLL